MIFQWIKGRTLVSLLIVAAIISGVSTYAALTITAPTGGDPNTVGFFLVLDFIILMLLGILIARRIWKIWQARRRGLAGSRLHVRLIWVFGLLAILPALVVALFSAAFFYVGLQSWFSDKVKTAVVEAQNVAQAYLHEHQQILKGDALAMANDLNREAARLSLDPTRFNQVVDTQALLRELGEVLVFEGTGKVLARSGYTFSLELEPLSEATLNRARQGELILFLNDNDNRVRALIRLDRYVDTFLYVGRTVDPLVLGYVQSTTDAVKSYTQLEARRVTLQVAATLIYVALVLLLLLVAIWYGLNFANQLVKPIGSLIKAASRVRVGDLSVRVVEGGADDELGMLGRAFNRMTDQLQSQRNDLMDVNVQLDLRRRFTEAVLEGVSAGVVSLDPEGRIVLMNPSARQLLSIDIGTDVQGRKLDAFIPELTELVDKINKNPERPLDAQVQMPGQQGEGGKAQTFHIRLSCEYDPPDIKGYVVTFDDISDLLSAQRKAAWADVARRIAHEIKNPLTPIQLSAERLRRKYQKEIVTDPDIFQQCTDTIVRQVDDIRRMVDEFSAFARLPKPVMREQDFRELVRQAVFLQSTANPGIHYETRLPDHFPLVHCDGRQIAQVLTNLLQNAADAIEGRKESLPSKNGRIMIDLGATDDLVTLAIQDNGCGLPRENRDRLTEPYVTTRSKGTGLGLAIVKKIMEDHNGQLILEDASGGGARASIALPRHPQGPSSVPVSESASHGS